MTNEERARAWLIQLADNMTSSTHVSVELAAEFEAVRASALREAAAVCRSMTLGRDMVYCVDLQYAEDAILALLDVKP